MESLARRFWRPVFAYVSATRPNQPLDSAAIAERFLVSLCQKNLDEVAPEIRSRLRTLIRTSLQLAGTSKFERYALPENADSTSIIGLTDTASLDLLPGTYPPDSSPEELFEYEWARSIAEASLRMLKKKLTAIGREGSWTMLQRHDFAWGDHRVKPLRELAQELRGSELGLRISLAYGRTLWRRLMLDQMSHTVQDVGDVVTELKEVHDLLPTWGAFWPLLRMVLNSDDDFILLQLYVEKARLRSDQIKGFADILELPGDRIGELMVQRNLVTTDQLWALLKQKEDHLTELMEGAATTIVAEQAPSMPAEVREALKKSENLIGKFVKVSFLGKGSTGNVWKCWDTKTGEYVAIKVFENLPMTRRVLREAQLSSKLDHPNIVRVRDLGRDGDSYYAVLDYVHGKTLGGERMPVKKALEVAFEVASAVDYAHQQGIIHRDLKPQNIMVNAFGKVVVLDFGIARQSSVESLGQGGVVLGTPQYMAPEQAAAGTDDVDIACDVYGVGATLYHLVSGRPP
ncbi:MAG TPA: serine/threonine-protein kinase, partial [Planctomycetota bacterium]|nr:serine/threonine-protein kinase [Planctomycetota bacterium]